MYQSKITQLSPATWFIETTHSSLFLLAGTERALLIDTAMGMEDFAALAKSLTPLPVVVVNTHGHPDHVMGNRCFSEIHIHPADLPSIQREVSQEERKRIKKDLGADFPPGLTVDEWVDHRPESVVPVQDRHFFDLGGRVIEVIATPGHTPGSICLLDRQERYLATGDTLHGGVVWMQLEESMPLDMYLGSLRKLQTYADYFDFLLPGHGDKPVPAQALEDMIVGVERILAGELVGEPVETFIAPGLQCLFTTCGILYGHTNPATDPAG